MVIKMKIVYIFLLAFSSSISYAQRENVVYKDFYYYDCSTVGKQHHNSWLLSGVSDKQIITNLNYCCEDSFVNKFIELTNHYVASDFVYMNLLYEWKEFDNFEKIDSIWNKNETIRKHTETFEYKIKLEDSTIVYMSVYKIKGFFYPINNLYKVLSSRNPPLDYYKRCSPKPNYILCELEFTKGIRLKRKERRHLKMLGIKTVCQ